VGCTVDGQGWIYRCDTGADCAPNPLSLTCAEIPVSSCVNKDELYTVTDQKTNCPGTGGPFKSCAWSKAKSGDWTSQHCSTEDAVGCTVDGQGWIYRCDTGADCAPNPSSLTCAEIPEKSGGGGTNEPTGKAAARFASSSLIILLTTIVLVLIGRIP